MPVLRRIEDRAVTVSPAFIASADKSDLDAVLAWLSEQGHTGRVTIHFAQGTPTRVELPREPQWVLLEKR
jgi:hypothetical protein